MKVLNEFVEPFVEKAISHSLDEIEGKIQTFTASLSTFTTDKTVLRDHLVNILLAGRDSTAAALSWLFYEMAYHPGVYAKLREEVLNTLGPHGKPTYDNLKTMKYLQCCINEGIPPSNILR
jgi:cytochrome P450